MLVFEKMNRLSEGLSKANVLKLLLVLFWLVLIPELEAVAQSTWKPRTNPNSPSKNNNPKIHHPKIDNFNYLYGLDQKSANQENASMRAAPSDTTIMRLLMMRQPLTGSAWWSILPSPPEHTASDSVSLLQPRDFRDKYEELLKDTRPRNKSLQVAFLVPRNSLTEFNNIFLAQELNGLDQRNHQTMEVLWGGDLAMSWRLGKRWGVRPFIQYERSASHDRQTWTIEPSDTSPLYVVRDDQEVLIQRYGLGCDFFLDGTMQPGMWTLFAGAMVQSSKVKVSYDIEELDWYDYEYESDRPLGFGAHLGASVVTPLKEALGLRLTLGYRLGSTGQFKMAGGDWFWESLDGELHDAKLQFSGVFAKAGVDYFF